MRMSHLTRIPGFVAAAFLSVALASPAVATGQDRGAQGRYYDSRAFTASLRINFQPTDANVYVDGGLAGRVADFDGIFQRLRLTAGNHVITISRPGFRPERHTVFVRRNTSETITGRLERLGGRGGIYDPWDDGRGTIGRNGSIAFQVLPSDAQVWVNGSRRSLIRRGNAYALDLQPGRHRIEVRRAGYQPYFRDVDIRSGATVSLNFTWRR